MLFKNFTLERETPIFSPLMRVLYLQFILLFLFVPAKAQIGNPVVYPNGLVVSASEEASRIGVEILKKGGNAIDAAVAVHFALAVTHPAAGNLGGGGFMVLRLANGETAALDFREKAPESATEKMFLNAQGEVDQDLALRSPLSSGVPGSVDGMITALEKYGTLPLDIVIEPAIRLAEEGFILSYEEALALNRNRVHFEKHEGSAEYFVRQDRNLWQEGDVLKQNDLAETLKRISQFGREGFYSGQVADLIVAEMKRNGGIMELGDLQSYRSKWRDPVLFRYRNFQLIGMPPPSSGAIVMAQILNQIKSFDLEEMGYGSSDHIHVLTEAEKRAFADRAYFLGDPDFTAIPTSALISQIYLNDRVPQINLNSATASSQISHGEIPGFKESLETTHFSVVDSDGNAVAVTTTLNGAFGNKIAVPGAGFLLNNEMDDFVSKPGEPNQFGLVGGKANAIEGGKRMLSSMTPTIVTENQELRMILGASGGSRIITTVTQIFLNVSEFGMNIQQAVSAPRFHHQWLPDKLLVESYAFPPEVRKNLVERGHIIEVRSGYLGRAQCIFVDNNGNKHGATDPRGEDSALGY
jgi:gamma-glutamyltranspeptidase/glutathione hydrolase